MYNKDVFEVWRGVLTAQPVELVLDGGCGDGLSDDPWQFLKEVFGKTLKCVVGVDADDAHVNRRMNLFPEYPIIRGRIEDVFPLLRSKSFDVVLLMEIVEHLPKEKALLVLDEALRLARFQVLVSTPNGFLKQEKPEKPLETHLCGFTEEDFKVRGYETKIVSDHIIAWKKFS